MLSSKNIWAFLEYFRLSYKLKKGKLFTNPRVLELTKFQDTLNRHDDESPLRLEQWNELGSIIYHIALKPLPLIGNKLSRQLLLEALTKISVTLSEQESIDDAITILQDKKIDPTLFFGALVLHNNPCDLARAISQLDADLSLSEAQWNFNMAILTQCQHPSLVVLILIALQMTTMLSEEQRISLLNDDTHKNILSLNKKPFNALELSMRFSALYRVFNDLSLLGKLNNKSFNLAIKYFDLLTAPKIRSVLIWLPVYVLKNSIDKLFDYCQNTPLSEVHLESHAEALVTLVKDSQKSRKKGGYTLFAPQFQGDLPANSKIVKASVP